MEERSAEFQHYLFLFDLLLNHDEYPDGGIELSDLPSHKSSLKSYQMCFTGSSSLSWRNMNIFQQR